MGIYLYAVKAKAHRITFPDGKIAVAHELSFVFNGGSFYTPTNLQKATQARIERYWEGKTLPEYVIHGSYKEGIERFNRVYRWTSRHPFWIDCDTFPGEQVGDVLEIRRGDIRVGWHTHEPSDPARVTPVMLEDGRDLCRICHDPYGEPNPERAATYFRRLDEEARVRAEADRKAWEDQQRANQKARENAQAERDIQSFENLGINLL